MTLSQRTRLDPGFRLDDRYTHRNGRIYLNGVQALVRLIHDRAHIDRASGRRTAAYISGGALITMVRGDADA
jgi:hypothetical protein